MLLIGLCFGYAVFLQSDAAAACFFLLYVLLQLLFEGGVFIFLAAPDINDSWVLPSVVETSCSYYTNSPSLETTIRNYSHTVHSLVPRPRPAFRRFPSLSGWKAGWDLGTRLHCACADYTSCFEGRIYFTSSFRLCSNYLRAATIQGWQPFKGGVFSMKCGLC